MPKLLGFYVIRSKRPSDKKRPVYAGITEERRTLHKEWILDNVSQESTDGETTFEDMEREIVVDCIGVYKTTQGYEVRIDSVDDRTCHGHVLKKNEKNKTVSGDFWYGWITGEPMDKRIEGELIK